jgi:hypothetical protein
MPGAPSSPITTDIPQRMDRLVAIALGITWLLDGLAVSIAIPLSSEKSPQDSVHNS